MAVTGTGTESDPWVVSTYAEMVEYLVKSRETESGEVYGNWVRLVADINCNEACPEGWITVNMYNNFDMYGHSIIAPLVKNGNKLFYEGNLRLTIKNGHILNIYENFSSGGQFFLSSNSSVSNFPSLENMQLDFYLRNKNVSLGDVKSVNNCRISIRGNYNNSNQFSSDTTFNSNIFELNYKNVSGTWLISGYKTRENIENCLFIGEVDNFILNGGTTVDYSGCLKNCIIAVKSKNTSERFYRKLGSNLLSSDTKGFSWYYGDGTVETLTDAQLKSLTDVQNTNFTVTPVSTTSGGT